jgi:hypothetical protein
MNTGPIYLPHVPSMHGVVISSEHLRIEIPDASCMAATWLLTEPFSIISLHFHKGVWIE